MSENCDSDCIGMKGMKLFPGGRPIWRLEEDVSNNKIWGSLGSMGKTGGKAGLFYFNTTASKVIVVNDVFPQAGFTAMCKDGSGNIYAGSSPDGIVIKYMPATNDFESLGKLGTQTGSIVSGLYYNGDLFFTQVLENAEQTPNLIILNISTGKIVEYPFPSTPNIKGTTIIGAIVKGNNDTLYFASYDVPYLFKFDPANPDDGVAEVGLVSFLEDEGITANGDIRSLALKASDGTIFGSVSGKDGLKPFIFKFNPTSGDISFETYVSEANADVFSLCYVAGKGLYIGLKRQALAYGADFYLWDDTTPELTLIKENLLAEKAITALVYDGADYVYGGTGAGAVLWRYNVDTEVIEELARLRT